MDDNLRGNLIKLSNEICWAWIIMSNRLTSGQEPIFNDNISKACTGAHLLHKIECNRLGELLMGE